MQNCKSQRILAVTKEVRQNIEHILHCDKGNAIENIIKTVFETKLK